MSAPSRSFPWALAILAVLIFGGVQILGGAYSAEFDGYPDEASHFMTGLMIRDFLVRFPWSHPVAWAEQYYLHYPKVAFGHWPPLFHFVEAIWWLLLPPSRFSAMLLIGLIGFAAAACFYRVARAIAPPAGALFVSCMLVAAPVFQESAGQVMAELLSLLFGVLFLDALVRFLRKGSGLVAAELGLWCGLCLLVKGTGVCLIPAPLLAVLLAGRLRALRIRSWITPAIIIIITLCFGFWLVPRSPFESSWFGAVAGWAGLDMSFPWTLEPLLMLAGAGCGVLAVAGTISLFWAPEPVAAAAASMVLSTAAVSFFLRAMDEPRHFILALPGILLLSLTCVLRALEAPSLRVRTLATALTAAVALGFFPWSHYRQQPSGYREFAQHIRQPARMFVASAEGWREGPWIAFASLREKRPSSVIVRATKVLMRAGWLGTHYRLLVSTPAAVEETLDHLAIETVIIDERGASKRLRPDYVLLRENLAKSSAWRICAQSRSLLAYCRVEPPQLPPEPLRIDLRRNLGRTISEP